MLKNSSSSVEKVEIEKRREKKEDLFACLLACSILGVTFNCSEFKRYFVYMHAIESLHWPWITMQIIPPKNISHYNQERIQEKPNMGVNQNNNFVITIHSVFFLQNIKFSNRQAHSHLFTFNR